MKEVKKINIWELIILLMPIIDIFNTITNKSLSLYFRGLFLVVIVGYFLFKTDSKYKKISISLLIIIGLFSGVYLLHYYTFNGLYNIVNEFTTLIKFIYLPVASIALFNIYQENRFDLNRTMLRLSFIFIVLTVIPTVMGIALPSYEYGKLGYSGLFYSPNELGSILAIISPFLILNLQENSNKIRNFLMTVLFIITCFILGTKTPIIGLIISILGVIVISVLNKIFHKKDWHNIVINVVLLLVFIGVYENSYLKYNLGYQGEEFETKESIKEQDKEGINKNGDYLNFPVNSYGEEYKDNKIINLVFSSRDVYLNSNLAKFRHSTLTNKIYGLSLGLNRNNNGATNMSELDFLDIFIYYGIVGFGVLVLYIVYILLGMLIKFFRDFKNNIVNNELCAMCLSFGIAVAISLMAGHTLSAPAVSSVIILPIVYLLEDFKIRPKKLNINYRYMMVGIGLFLGVSGIVIFKSYKPVYSLNITLGDALEFQEEVLMLDQEKFETDMGCDTLTYYVPKKYQNLSLIHVLRENKGVVTNYFTVINNEAVTANINILIDDKYDSLVKNTNSVSFRDSTNILGANTYYYTLDDGELTSFNKYAVKNFIKEESDYKETDKGILKEMVIEPFTSADTYIIDSKDSLINKDEEIEWLSFNGTYELNKDSLYTRNISTLDLKYGKEFNNILLDNYLLVLDKYSNIENGLYYKEYENSETKNVHFASHSDAYINYQIYEVLEKNKIENDLLDNFVLLVKEKYEEEDYLKNGSVVFNSLFDKTFDNMVGVLNILTHYLIDNKDDEVNKIVLELLGELGNSKWIDNNNIHEYIDYKKKYVGSLLDKRKTLDNLLILDSNLDRLKIDRKEIKEYIEILSK